MENKSKKKKNKRLIIPIFLCVLVVVIATLVALIFMNQGSDNTDDSIMEFSAAYANEFFEKMDITKSEENPWVIDYENGIFSLNFDVDDSKEYSSYEVKIEYLDEGEGNFTVLYNSFLPKLDITTNSQTNTFETGSFVELKVLATRDILKQSETVELTDSKQWKETTFTLSDADFKGSINGYDFALTNYVPNVDYVYPTTLTVRSVTVTGTDEKKSQQSDMNLSYNIIDTSDESVILSGEQVVNLETAETLDFDIGLSIEKNSVYELQINVPSAQEMTVVEPFTVMDFNVPDSTLNDMFGVCTHFGLEWFNGDVALTVDTANLMGADWIRDEISWRRAETEKGTVEILAEWDLFVDEAIKDGLKPILILAYGNPNYDEGGAPYTEEGLAAYANYVSVVVEHFKGRVEHFEIWNEYNLEDTLFNPTSRPPEDYTKLLEVAYKAVKTANPNATVIGGAMSGVDVEWLEAVLESGGGQYMDALSYHPYMQPKTPEYGGFLTAALELPNILEKYDVTLPLWITEVGWPTSLDNAGSNELDAANYLVRTYILGTVANIEKIFWYDLIDDGNDPYNMEHNFGMVESWTDSEAPLAPKFSFLAYNTVSNQLSDAEYLNFQGLSDNIFVSLYQQQSGEHLLVAWTIDGEASLTLNMSSSSANVTDIFSNTTTNAVENGKLQLELSPSPIFIEGVFTSDPLDSFDE